LGRVVKTGGRAEFGGHNPLSLRQVLANIEAGLLGALSAGVALILVETAVIVAWWRGALVAPRALTRTQMFDSLSDLSAWGWRYLTGGGGAEVWNRVYPPGWTGTWLLCTDLSVSVLPLALVLGLFYGFWRTLRRKKCSVVGSALWLIGLATVADLVLWVNSVHLPSHVTPYIVFRNTLKSIALDGEWVSLLVFGSLTAIFLGCRHAAVGGIQVRALRGRTLSAVLILIVGVAAAGLATMRQVGDTGRVRPEPTIIVDQHPSGVRPNIVLVSIDSLRADHLGCYGWSRNTSPRIDGVASSGVLFADAWATTSWTLPSHASILTGRSLLGHGVLESRDKVPRSIPLLAEMLKRAGYKTAGFVSAPYLSSSYGFNRGFDLYDDKTVAFASHKESHGGTTAPLLHRVVASWLRREAVKQEQPFFLFVHYWDVHYDYNPPAPFSTMFDPGYQGDLSPAGFIGNPRINAKMSQRDLEHVVALYDGEIRFTDQYVGRLLDLLDDLGVATRTVVILTADHGDEFFEHGNKGHQRTLYQEVLHVPLVISWPSVLPAGEIRRDPVSLVDVFPTVLSLAGVRVPSGIEGRDLFGGVEKQQRMQVAELYRKQTLNLQVAVRLGNYKLIQSLNYPKLEVFDLAKDQGERRPNLDSVTRGPLLAGLGRWMAERWGEYAAREASGGHETAVVSQEHIRALRALGYVE